MKTVNTNYKCPTCANGVIVRQAKQSGINFEIKMIPCNCCKNAIGIKGVEKLKLIE